MRRPRMGVRARTTVLATLVLGVALSAAALLLYTGLQRTRLQEVDVAAGLLATELAGRIHQGNLVGAQAPVGSDVLVQVLNPQGVTALSSSALPRDVYLTAPLLSLGGQPPITTGSLGPRGHPHRLLVLGVKGPNGTWTVAVASSLEFVERTTQRGAVVLGVGTPLLVAVAALSTWLLVGRALAPVESIMRTAASVRGTALGQRVPVPEGNDEVSRLATTVNHMLDRLEAASKRQQSFAADASHELRTPLTAARGELELALLQRSGTDWPGAARATLHSLARLEQTISDLLLLTRADEGALARAEDVDVDDLVLAEVRRLRELVPDKAVLLTAVAPARVQGDAASLARALRNLGDNAARHAHSRIDLSLRRDGAHAVLTVIDDGPGIPRHDRERVFERFVRLDEARDRDHGGTGLGLALCREIVAAHAGTIEVLDTSHGATFLLRLPILLDPGSDGTPRRGTR